VRDNNLLPPLSLYVHLPWCIRKCPYCDFNSFESRETLPERAYVDALLRDLDSELAAVRPRPLESVFIGGGTPSLFSADAISVLLDGIRARLTVEDGTEVTLEANPGAAEAERFAGYRGAGVNRISIGLQSLRDDVLARLGRVHSAAEAQRAVAAAHEAGFVNINVDLMYGLPGEQPEDSVADLTRALELEPTHLSWYQLTLEPQTAFARNPPMLPDDEAVEITERAGRRLLAERGFERYEVSAYARAGYRCDHNLNYWQFGDYLGIGAGAHGKITLIREDAIERRAKTRNPRTFMRTAGTAEATQAERIDDPAALRLEFLMNALRLVDGVSWQLLASRVGALPAGFDAGLEEARRRGWIDSDCARLRPTSAGLGSLNRLLALL
jgi:putative oxygen-independent coproporphyrinogen III oxidase